MFEISGFHAHVYFDASNVDQAGKLCDTAGEKFAVIVGRKHKKAVGPHPCWSCQIKFEPELFGELIPWLALNRNGLTIFVHPETGDDFMDHTEYSMWMGKIEPLNLDMFKPES